MGSNYKEKKVNMFTHAITRKPGFDFADGLTTNDIDVPDYDLMQAQHVIYVNIMRSLGLMVLELDALPGYPDAYFVEDVAVVTPKVAIVPMMLMCTLPLCSLDALDQVNSAAASGSKITSRIKPSISSLRDPMKDSA